MRRYPADLFATTTEGPPAGTIEGPPGWQEGLGAVLRCWCGPAIGWRDFGELANGGTWTVIVHQHGRLTAGLIFDLGPHRFRHRRQAPATTTCNPADA